MMVVTFEKLRNNQLLKDSTWAVFGNGVGYLFVLLSGIVIARIIGKDLYGEYGVVKNAMLYVGALASFGTGLTSTKYIAESISKSTEGTKMIIRNSVLISLSFSVLLGVLLFLFAVEVADLMDQPKLISAFKYLGIIIVFRALTITQSGILSGLKKFKVLGINNILAGFVFLALSYPLTSTWGLIGAFYSLITYHAVLFFANILFIFPYYKGEKDRKSGYSVKKILSDSFPLTLQGLSEYLANFVLIFFFTKYASLGEYALFSVATQWNAIVIFIPSLLSNVVLSYLSTSLDNNNNYFVLFRRMVYVNLFCSLGPFIGVVCFSGIIVSFYGPTFSGLQLVLCVYLIASVSMCTSQVYVSDMIARNGNWKLLFFKVVRDVFIVAVSYVILSNMLFDRAALIVSVINIIGAFLFLLILSIDKRLSIKEYKNI